MTTATIQKWGNSHGIRLTKDILDSLGVSAGSTVYLKKSADGLTIEVDKKDVRNMTLDEMLKTIPKDFSQKEYDWGKVKGNEVW